MRHPVCGRRVTVGLMVAAAVGVGAGTGCSSKGDGGTGPTGTIALVLGAAAATVVQGGTTQVAATLTRGGGFTADVVFSVEGVPTGSTGAVSNAATSGGTTTATVTISGDAVSVPGSYTLIVRARGTGVSDATATLTLTITATPAYTLALAPGIITVAQGSSDVVQVAIDRTNYAGAITLSLDGAPAAMTGVFAPAAPTGTSSTLTIAVGAGAAPGQYNLIVRGTGAAALRADRGVVASIVDRSAPLTLTVTVAANRIAAGSYYTLAIKPDGTLWAWGTNPAGQLGDGTLSSRLTPIQTGNGATWRAIVAGSAHSMALKSDGTLWAWGYNSFGQLGDGTTATRLTPMQIGTRTWRAIAAGEEHTIAVRSDGTLWAWGRNLYGRLGDGTEADRLTPTQIGTGTTWQAVAAGARHSIALKSDGTLWAWGNNGNGQLGDGTIFSKDTPMPIASGVPWAAIAAGRAHTLALKADGTLWAWGHDGFGQLGDGTTGGPINQSRLTPTSIGGGSTWRAIAAGAFHTVALKTEGTLWTWGLNDRGQLGDGTMNNLRSAPTQIGTGTTWTAVAAGEEHTIAVRSDGTLWTWGFNGLGQLGDGTTTSRVSPTPIGF